MTKKLKGCLLRVLVTPPRKTLEQYILIALIRIAPLLMTRQEPQDILQGKGYTPLKRVPRWLPIFIQQIPLVTLPNPHIPKTKNQKPKTKN